jgi:hypothetical protein
MSKAIQAPSRWRTLLSTDVYGKILHSPDLSERLLPDGLARSPYRVLDYRAVLELHDVAGTHATFHRVQRVQFLQPVSAVLDHFWGDGVGLSFYRNSAGTVEEILRDGDRYHLVIELPRRMRRGEILEFEVERAAMAMFAGEAEWVETRVDHPTRQLSRVVVFPKDRPALVASLIQDGQELPLPVHTDLDGRTFVAARISRPPADTPYLVRWRW